MVSRPLPDNRYGVDIKVPTVHKECVSLGEVLDLLEGQAGVARVFDRHSQTMLVDGAVSDVRDALEVMAAVSDAASCREVPRARHNGPASHGGVEPEGYRVEVSGALNIASAYYFGDLGGVVRRQGRNGEDRFFRPMINRMRTAG